MLNELLEMLAQSQSGSSGQSESEGQDPLGGIMQELLGGGAQDAGSPGDVSGLLETLMGGMGSGQQSGGGAAMSGLLGALIGGMGGSQPGASGALGGNPMLMPFTEALAERLGISQQMASVIMSAAFMLLMNMAQQSTKHGAGQPSRADLDGIMDEEYLVSSGMASRVAQQTGMEKDEAARSLQEALQILTGDVEGQQEVEQQPAVDVPNQPTDLGSLLDSWEVD